MKKYSLKFWFAFWLLATVFLMGWFLFWNIKNQGVFVAASRVATFLPIGKEKRSQLQALAKMGELFGKKSQREKTFLLLFQNTLEMRPGGGFVGSIGILKTNGGKIVSFQTHDVSAFDVKIPNVQSAPAPISQIMHQDYWKLRDSNFSPDFEINAQKAAELYALSGENAKIDGVVGITSNVLSSVLKITGPLSIEGYPGTYDSNNAIIALEYQVEKAFQEQGIAREERKSIMGDLSRVIEKRILSFSIIEKIRLARVLLEDLRRKDIQLQFADQDLQAAIEKAAWAGKVDTTWQKDFLMTSDSNLGAFKSDYYIKRKLDYGVDFSASQPSAQLQISYTHSATQKDWMTKDYLSYFRVYVPKGATLLTSDNFEKLETGEEFGKEFFSAIIKVPLGTTKTFKLTYLLPKNISQDDYALLVQKQAGINDTPLFLHVIEKNGNLKEFKYILSKDILIKKL